jgi:VIT1/CCC1 family predicted Fe2+/Mn2+ transporter
VREFAEHAVARGGRPHVPNTPERARLEKERRIREVIFGIQDGVLTTLGIVTGVGAAAADRATIVLTGVVALVVGMLSMGVGEYLGGKTEREVVRAAIALETREMAANPEEEFAEQVAYYQLKGFTRDEATMIVTRLATNPEIWLHEMMRDEFGIDPRVAEGGGVRPALIMGASFAAGAFVPIVPYLIGLPVANGLGVAIVLAAAALFTIGVFAARISNRNIFSKGFELVGYGALVFIASYAAGHFIPALFGHPPVNAG